MGEDAPGARTLAEGLARLVGEQLSSVEFVQDHVQLRFDGPCVTAFTWPVVRSASESLSWGQPGYRDALCSQISHLVERTEVDAQQVAIIFESGVVFSISLREDDYQGPEALNFTLNNRHWWVA